VVIKKIMRIILTHEQADFDALASLLGAALLDDKATPVLPRRMNRNVQSFINLYGIDLPFIEARDLSPGPIRSVTLVDTQTMVSIKGVDDQTSVSVIDHHPKREMLPESWNINLVDTGATTTVLVEELREQDVSLTMVEATLLLLGIYEDTGSLVYTRTTGRDLRAAAFLLEHGANLRIAINFLNHPLTPAQEEIYDQLRAHAEYQQIHGYSIVIATADAGKTEEELSTIAHKLRDLLDPDALFVLVSIRSGVQMIARSGTDNIDVAAILSNFGGGGHERAAAGLVRSHNLAKVRDDLMKRLSGAVRPAITVAQIMSRSPQVLGPEDSVENAAERMRRYGYEGFPIVQDGKVIGLLTRRLVDRAQTHNYKKPISSVMDAGTYTVFPGDSIERLQRLMTDSGWGQIPVISPDTGEIIGIVTRTDLLKTLPSDVRQPRAQNLAARLEAALSPERLNLLKAVAQTAHEQPAAVYIVGGFVRDLLLNRPSLDFDLVVEGDAIKLARRLAQQYGGRVTSHARFGTAKWHLKDSAFAYVSADVNDLQIDLSSIDLISARTEFYTHPTALPTVERGSIKLDLHRRDFTINTLAMRLDGHHYGELHDYWGGLEDLRLKRVRVLHSLSFVDDPTRMLRAVRFEQRFGFNIETRTLELLKEAAGLLSRVSGDRIRHELNHIFGEPHLRSVLGRLDKLGLLSAIHHDLVWDNWLSEHLEALPLELPGDEWELEDGKNIILLHRNLAYILCMLRLEQEKERSICERLKITISLRQAIYSAGKLWSILPEMTDWRPSQVVAYLDEVPPISRYAVYLAASEPNLQNILWQYATHLRKITPTISGDDLRNMGLPPGPAYREILATLRQARLDELISSTGQENELLEQLVKQYLDPIDKPEVSQ
jgi:tRNA nucleotidyltransferase (CCA-adding enzyme)